VPPLLEPGQLEPARPQEVAVTRRRSMHRLQVGRSWPLAPLLAAGALVAASACGDSGALVGGSVTHASFFLVTGSHQGFTCDTCHDPAAPSFSAAANGADCLACHSSADCSTIHAAVGGYAYATPTCIGCHKDGSAGLPANHDSQLFPITNTKHAGIGCGQCHGATKSVADLKCTPCHDQATTNGKHTAIPASTTGERSRTTVVNYQWSTPYCLKCHADGQVDRIAAHPTVRHGLNGEGHAPFCLTCHTTLRTGTKPWGVNFDSFSCLACHTDNNGGGGG
jgi:hypothetical protein